MIVNLTGHRNIQNVDGVWISKLAYPGADGNSRKLYNRLIDLFTAYYKKHPEIEVIITGMALGTDLGGARAALNLGIPVHSYIPYKGHGDTWKSFYKEEHASILSMASYVYSPDVEFSREALLQRNRDMVDNSDYTLALWDGSRGGTGACVRYAIEKRGEDAWGENLWPSWVKYRERNG